MVHAQSASSANATFEATKFRWPALILALFLVGCASSGAVTGSDKVTKAAGQSETDATTTYQSRVHRIVVAFNDETGNEKTILYDATNRKVLRGASLMGWSFSEDNGKTWKYGGKVKPPPGWAVLWGDPAVTTSRINYGLAFMSNLAFPDAKFPKNGIDGYVFSAVGGACVARSTDGGVTFKNFQCLTNKDAIPGIADSPKGHFYDGGSMAASPAGDIYAAYVDVDNSQVDIWRSPDGTQPFTRLPQPFPNYYVGSHPRIRVGNDGTLFAMAEAKASGESANQSSTYVLVANRYRNGAWETPRVVTSAIALYPDVDLGAQALGFPLTVRTGPQYSFDLGARSEDRDDSVRFMVTQYNNKGWLFVRGGICDYQLQSCGWFQGWTFGVAQATDRDTQRLDTYNPNVAAFPGFIGIAPRWQSSFVTRYGNSTTTLNVTRATLGYVNGTPFSIPVDIAKDVPVCSDRRGYWGDYDGFLHVQIDNDNLRFMRFTTDSSLGCVKRWQFVGEHQHVRAVDYWY